MDITIECKKRTNADRYLSALFDGKIDVMRVLYGTDKKQKYSRIKLEKHKTKYKRKREIMGQYYSWVNIKRKEYIDPVDFDIEYRCWDTIKTINLCKKKFSQVKQAVNLVACFCL